MIDKAILLAFSFLMILVLSLQFILLSLPFFQRMAFDAICHRALMRMDDAGGMTNSIRMSLDGDLLTQGFTDQQIHGDASVPFGEEMTLLVQVNVPVRHISPALQMESSVRTFIYQNSILSRHLLTAAGEP